MLRLIAWDLVTTLILVSVPVASYIFCHCDTVECQAAGVQECRAEYYCYTMFENNQKEDVIPQHSRSMHRGCVVTEMLNMCHQETSFNRPTLVTQCCRDAWCNSYENLPTERFGPYGDNANTAHTVKGSERAETQFSQTQAKNFTTDRFNLQSSFKQKAISSKPDSQEKLSISVDRTTTKLLAVPEQSTGKHNIELRQPVVSHTMAPLLITIGLITALSVVVLLICLCLCNLGQRTCVKRSLNTGSLEAQSMVNKDTLLNRCRWISSEWWRGNRASCDVDKNAEYWETFDILQRAEINKELATEENGHSGYENCYCCQNSTGTGSTQHQCSQCAPLDGHTVHQEHRNFMKKGLTLGVSSLNKGQSKPFSHSSQHHQLFANSIGARGKTQQKFLEVDRLTQDMEDSPNPFLWIPDLGTGHNSATIYSGPSLSTECSQGSQEIKAQHQQRQFSAQAVEDQDKISYPHVQFINTSSSENMISPPTLTLHQKTTSTTTNNSLFEQRHRGTGTTNSVGEESRTTPSNERSGKDTIMSTNPWSYPAINEWIPVGGVEPQVECNKPAGLASDSKPQLMALAHFRRGHVEEELVTPYAQYQLTPEQSVYGYT